MSGLFCFKVAFQNSYSISPQSLLQLPQFRHQLRELKEIKRLLPVCGGLLLLLIIFYWGFSVLH
jgi:hypothetical protein